MKKVNLIIIATIIATFVISMFAVQPTKSQSSNNALPMATPSPQKITKAKKPSELVTEITFPKIKANSTKSKKKSTVKWEGPANDKSKVTKTRKRG